MLQELNGINNIFTLEKGIMISILNSATKKWKVYVGVTASGPWNEIANGEFPDPIPDPNNIPLFDTIPSGYNIPLTYQVSFEFCHV